MYFLRIRDTIREGFSLYVLTKLLMLETLSMSGSKKHVVFSYHQNLSLCSKINPSSSEKADCDQVGEGKLVSSREDYTNTFGVPKVQSNACARAQTLESNGAVSTHLCLPPSVCSPLKRHRVQVRALLADAISSLSLQSSHEELLSPSHLLLSILPLILYCGHHYVVMSLAICLFTYKMSSNPLLPEPFLVHAHRLFTDCQRQDISADRLLRQIAKFSRDFLI